MKADLRQTTISQLDDRSGTPEALRNDFTRRRHAEAALIPSGPPLG